jgi:hypothetical protein
LLVEKIRILEFDARSQQISDGLMKAKEEEKKRRLQQNELEGLLKKNIVASISNPSAENISNRSDADDINDLDLYSSPQATSSI